MNNTHTSSDERTPLLSLNAERHSRWDDVLDPLQCKLPLGIQCFTSGLSDCISYTSAKTWIAFMTGNLTQTSLSLVGIITEDDPTDAINRLKFSGAAIFGFCLGAYLTSRFQSKTLGKRSRLVIVTGLHCLVTLIVLTLIISINSWDLSRNSMLILALSTSMGSQSSLSISLGTHPYSTTVVFTNQLTQIFSDSYFPSLLQPLRDSRDEKEFKSRHRLFSILLLIGGGLVGAIVMECKKRVFQGHVKGKEETAGLALLLICQLVVVVAWSLAKGKQRPEQQSSSS